MLSEMIKKGHAPWMNLAVGKPKYKQIIEETLVSISSLFNYILDNFDRLFFALASFRT